MNANELADALFTVENYYTKPQDEVLISHVATMLRQQQAEITKLKLEWQYMADLTEKLQDFAIWMTGCGYDFCQHEYFIKCRDELLKGVRNE